MTIFITKAARKVQFRSPGSHPYFRQCLAQDPRKFRESRGRVPSCTAARLSSWGCRRALCERELGEMFLLCTAFVLTSCDFRLVPKASTLQLRSAEGCLCRSFQRRTGFRAAIRVRAFLPPTLNNFILSAFCAHWQQVHMIHHSTISL